MDEELIDQFSTKCFDLKFETVRKWAKNYPDIGNVLRGLTDNCFALLGDFEQTDEICFAYITYSTDNPGIFLKLKFGEENFYNFLLCFSLEITKVNKKAEAIGVYNTFVHQLRTFLEANDIATVTTSELKNLGNGSLISASQTEVIKTFDRIKFYRKCFGIENYENLVENGDYVYIMMNQDDFTFKIGQSKMPIYRERTLQSKQPKVVLLKVWQCNKKIEKELHRMYQKNRVRGEWFKFDFGELCEIDNKITQIIEKDSTI